MPALNRRKFLGVLASGTAYGPERPAARLVPVALGHAANSVNATIFCHPVASLGDVQYAAFYDPGGQVILARRKLGKPAWDIRRTGLRGNTKDAHNGISLGLDGAGRLHMAWDHHASPLKYVQSAEPGSLLLTEPLPLTGTRESRVTYPEFFRVARGGLLMLYRDGSSGRGDTILKRYDPVSRRWSAIAEPLITGEGERNAYTFQIAVDRRGAWHLAWCWRETPDVSSNHDLCYARSADEGRTWTSSSGAPLRLPVTAATAEYALRIPQGSDLINQCTIAVDSRGRPVIAAYWKPDGEPSAQYQVLWHDGGKWRAAQVGRRKGTFRLGGAGTRSIPISRPMVLCGRDGEVFVVFRDEERGNAVSVARCRDLRNPVWRIAEISTEPLDRWEPTCDRELWASRGVLHMLHQRVGQGDGEQSTEVVPQMVSILEWQP